MEEGVKGGSLRCLHVRLLGVGRGQELLGLGSWPPLSRMEQCREAAGGRPLRMLHSRESFSMCKAERGDVQRSAVQWHV